MKLKKALTGVTVKDAEQGIVEGVFCTFDVVDRDGDVHRKGCFAKASERPVVISAYGHKSWDGELPVGYGTIREVGNEARFEAKFLMQLDHARTTFEVVKALSEQGIQEWSYSLWDVEAERGTFEGKNVRFLNEVGLVKEVSPTLMGAGINTRTLATKSTKQLAYQLARMLGEAGTDRWPDAYVYLDDFDIDDSTAVFVLVHWDSGERTRTRLQVDFIRTDTSVSLGDTETEVEYTTLYLPKGGRFSEHRDTALRGVKSLVEMAVQRLTLRTADGKSITEQTDAYDQLLVELAPLKAAIETATHPTPADEDDDTANDEFASAVVAFLADTAPN